MHGTIPRVCVDNRWTEAEDAILCEVWPDRQEACRRLPHRSFEAVKTRARNLKITKRVAEKDITGREARRIKELCACFSSSAVVAMIVGRNAGSVSNFIYRMGWSLKKEKPVVTGFALYDEVRRRAFEMNLSYRDLDRSLGYSNRFFSKPQHASKVSVGMIKNAVEALGGRLVVEWESLNGDEND